MEDFSVEITVAAAMVYQNNFMRMCRKSHDKKQFNLNFIKDRCRIFDLWPILRKIKKLFLGNLLHFCKKNNILKRKKKYIYLNKNQTITKSNFLRPAKVLLSGELVLFPNSAF